MGWETCIARPVVQLRQMITESLHILQIKNFFMDATKLQESTPDY